MQTITIERTRPHTIRVDLMDLEASQNYRQYVGEAFPQQCQCGSEFEHFKSWSCMSEQEVQLYVFETYVVRGERVRKCNVIFTENELKQIKTDWEAA